MDGINKYNKMQIKRYEEDYTTSYQQAIDKCVGNFAAHEAYPYAMYLLEHYTTDYERALDFGCGVGRMILRMLKYFDRVDGADLIQNNLNYAKQYLGDKVIDVRTKLFLTSGINCNVPKSEAYDFIYSTICLQHIPVHAIRHAILIDFYYLLKFGGQLCFQVGFGWDNGRRYWDQNHFDVQSINGGADFCIPDESHFLMVQQELEDIGFSDVKFEVKPSPHPNMKRYHPNWLFIHARR